MPKLIQTIWNEPRAPDAPGVRWHDWVLVGLILALSCVEVATRENIVWLYLALGLNTLFALVLPWRRQFAVYLVALVFPLNSSVQLYALTHGVEWTGLYTTVLVLVLPFALLRWSSGKQALAGLAVILMTFAATSIVGRSPWGEIAGAALFILFPSTLGLFFRLQSASQRRSNEQIRLREREQLARELHDTVGHYMSAIAVQAQAGRALAATDSEAPVRTLRVIEDASRNALAEMRSILKTMRESESVAYSPAASLEDVRQLADQMSYPFEIDIEIPAELPRIDGVLASTLYRLTQESITNTARHGREVTKVVAEISEDNSDVVLSVRNDGAPTGLASAPGLGIQGMKERVSLLGGEFEAGPAPGGGWVVRARLPLLGLSA